MQIVWSILHNNLQQNDLKVFDNTQESTISQEGEIPINISIALIFDNLRVCYARQRSFGVIISVQLINANFVNNFLQKLMILSPLLSQQILSCNSMFSVIHYFPISQWLIVIFFITCKWKNYFRNKPLLFNKVLQDDTFPW